MTALFRLPTFYLHPPQLRWIAAAFQVPRAPRLIRATISDTGWLCVADVNFSGIPNAFTPNDDGSNDQFVPVGLSRAEVEVHDFRIFNRWENLVQDVAAGVLPWDGRFQGQVQPVDVYLYYLTYQVPGQAVVILKGEVTWMH